MEDYGSEKLLSKAASADSLFRSFVLFLSFFTPPNLYSAWQLERNKTRELWETRRERGWLKFKPMFRIAARGRRIHLHGTRCLLVASLKY